MLDREITRSDASPSFVLVRSYKTSNSPRPSGRTPLIEVVFQSANCPLVSNGARDEVRSAPDCRVASLNIGQDTQPLKRRAVHPTRRRSSSVSSATRARVGKSMHLDATPVSSRGVSPCVQRRCRCSETGVQRREPSDCVTSRVQRRPEPCQRDAPCVQCCVSRGCVSATCI